MPKFRIGYEFDVVGSCHEDIVEADNLEQAEEIAWEVALERVYTWAEPYEEGG